MTQFVCPIFSLAQAWLVFPEGSDKTHRSNYPGQLNPGPGENNSFTNNNNFTNARAIPLSLRHGIGSRLQVYVLRRKMEKKVP